MTIEAINPANGRRIRSYEEMSEKAVDERLTASYDAFHLWRKSEFTERSERLMSVSAVLSRNKDTYARLMATEMGKPIGQGRAEVEKCAWVCEHYAKWGPKMLEPERIETDGDDSFVSFQPLGPIFAVMPWNYPFWQVFRFAVPTLMAGNTAILKHASNVPGCGEALVEIFTEAGFPTHVFQNLLISSSRVEAVIAHPCVKAVTLTGSVKAGRAVASAAGKALKKSVLELGGSDPSIVLADADIDQAAETCVSSRLLNSGQSCISAKRFLVEETVREEFEKRFVEKMQSKNTGDPLDESVDIGPLARSDLRDTLHRQVTESIDKGAKLLLGGRIPEGSGFYYPLTVLSNVRKGMPAFDEETFGPVAAVIPVADEKEAIELANDTRYGLGSSVYTRDSNRGKRIAEKNLEAGNCFVNAFVKSDPRLPFGGVKESGYGRELSHFGIREFVNIKTVYLHVL